MNTILQTEALLNMLNTLLAKAMYFVDSTAIQKLENMKHAVYYEGANPVACFSELTEVEAYLKKHD